MVYHEEKTEGLSLSLQSLANQGYGELRAQGNKYVLIRDWPEGTLVHYGGEFGIYGKVISFEEYRANKGRRAEELFVTETTNRYLYVKLEGIDSKIEGKSSIPPEYLPLSKAKEIDINKLAVRKIMNPDIERNYRKQLIEIWDAKVKKAETNYKNTNTSFKEQYRLLNIFNNLLRNDAEKTKNS